MTTELPNLKEPKPAVVVIAPLLDDPDAAAGTTPNLKLLKLEVTVVVVSAAVTIAPGLRASHAGHLVVSDWLVT